MEQSHEFDVRDRVEHGKDLIPVGFHLVLPFSAGGPRAVHASHRCAAGG